MEVYLTVVSNNLNQILKTLTIIATIMLPLTLISGIYGMNVDYPGVGSHLGFWSAMGLMGGIGALLVYYFRRRKWL